MLVHQTVTVSRQVAAAMMDAAHDLGRRPDEIGKAFEALATAFDSALVNDDPEDRAVIIEIEQGEL